jgi:hypothetical protein
VAFHTVNKEQSNKKRSSFIIASKRIKYLRINLTKEMRDAQWKLTNVSEGVNKWNDIPCLLIRRLDATKLCT